jgi:hypothetical protein
LSAACTLLPALRSPLSVLCSLLFAPCCTLCFLLFYTPNQN